MHPRATKPIEMLSESLNEILMTVKFGIQYRKSYDPEYWGVIDENDQVMSVWTSTNPGYFFPEEIAAGRVQTDDLIFGFSVPRSMAPKEVLEVMYKATMYAQSRLGGQILDENGFSFDIAKERDKIGNVLVNLESKSIKSG